MTDKEHKKVIVGLVLSWVVGVIFILGSLGAIFSLELIMSLVLFLMGSILIPPLNKFISNKIKLDLSSKLIKALIIIIGFVIIGVFTDIEKTTPATQEVATPQEISTNPAGTQEEQKETPLTQKQSTPTATKPEWDLEMTMEEIVNTFSGLSEIQQEEKMKEFKGKRIKTSIYASKIDKASLSTQYVVLEMYEYPYNLLPYAKAFFPSEEKDNLLKANIGDTIIFSGEFVSYKEGGLTSTVEFTKSKFIGIEKE